MFGLSFTEIMLVAVIALVFIGPKRLPEVARALARGFAEFRKAMTDVQASVYREVHQPVKDAKNDYLDTLLKERAKERREGPPPETSLTLTEVSAEEVETTLAAYRKSDQALADNDGATPPATAPASPADDEKTDG